MRKALMKILIPRIKGSGVKVFLVNTFIWVLNLTINMSILVSMSFLLGKLTGAREITYVTVILPLLVGAGVHFLGLLFQKFIERKLGEA